ncbi:MAG: tryptophanase [Nanoarchaeota archaeon]|nr:tryptophanase [Nanoarchaeota archaeon]
MQVPPFKIKVVEPIKVLSEKERRVAIEKAGFNPFLLSSKEVFIDLLTDSGTSAMSDKQWSGLMLGDESYAGSVNFDHLREAVNDVMGFPYVLPTHQGRGAEHVLDKLLIKKGQVVPGNIHFDTTKAHIENREGKAVDCTVDEVYDTSNDFPFKGNVDIQKLKDVIQKYGKKIAYILVTITCNSGGGQPVSLANIKEVSEIAKKNNILFFIDAARYAENAYFIQQREFKGKKPIKDIVKEMFSYADGCLMSAKKDALVNIGGFIALRDENIYRKLCPINVLFEGFPTYGGLAGRDMEAMAIGLREGVEEEYLSYRINQVKYLGDKLIKQKIPVVQPIGGHAVYIDAKKFFPGISQGNFPGHTLCVELFIEGGVRAVEIGTLLAGRDPDTKENIYPKLELTRLTVPRRVYTKEHLDYVADIVSKVYSRRDSVKGLEFDYEAPVLRHFQSRFKILK